MPSPKTYRSCVLAVFINDAQLVLVARRSGTNCWQFPQGGVEADEDHESALKREMHEEIGVGDFRILAKVPEPIPYDFPPDLGIALAKKYRGQNQYWYLCALPAGSSPNLAAATDHEFDAVRWTTAKLAYQEIVGFKKSSYLQGLTALGLISQETKGGA